MVRRSGFSRMNSFSVEIHSILHRYEVDLEARGQASSANLLLVQQSRPRGAAIMVRESMMNNAVKLIIAVAVPVVIGGLSGFATSQGVSTWYPTLAKPSFNPPAAVFGPVWTVLYIMMGVAAYLVWRQGFGADGVKAALVVFVGQLALNGLWSILFFGMRQPGWALVEIVVLWVAIGATIWLFWRVVPAAGALLLPYWAWVSFATILNASLWWLNRSAGG
jgi:tryptophan-rich sensory protein